MPGPQPPAQGAKDYRERYQELIGPSFGGVPSLSPMSHAGDPPYLIASRPYTFL
jgi:hypothetical protein